jgi:two-component system KDP operon response regulator KdpE
VIADPATILVIDDEPSIRRLLKATLGAHDHRVVEAASAREALMLMRHDRPDLVLLDLGLPDMEGQALLQAIRSVSAVPVIVLSSRSGEFDKVSWPRFLWTPICPN